MPYYKTSNINAQALLMVNSPSTQSVSGVFDIKDCSRILGTHTLVFEHPVAPG